MFQHGDSETATFSILVERRSAIFVLLNLSVKNGLRRQALVH